ncbi:hypothetical protein F2Q70_00004889 [Brassica cretica]|uniref:Uncharacterized protein n=1 Tax=Brassica cretica TaxID=69181 RepID=A0A8S9J264_BRACR|nr:hypothetical protein F2Q70_00004889 [Brassica cretica]
MATKKGLMDRVSSWSAQGKDCKAQTQLLEPPKVIAVGKSSDLVLMVLDASKILTKELAVVGIRLNKRPPQICLCCSTFGKIDFGSLTPDNVFAVVGRR